MDGSRRSQSLVGDVLATELLCVCHIGTSGTICSSQVGLQNTHCHFFVDDGEALASY